MLQDRAEPDGLRFRIAFAVLRATGPPSAAEPLLFIAGGPGEPTLQRVPELAGAPFFRAVRAQRDLVFFDQRGTGGSEPALCDELDRVLFFDGLAAPAHATLLDRQLRTLRECRRKLESRGIDLADFNSTSGAHDVYDLLTALGHGRADLYGHSYGSRLALAVMREHAGLPRSVLMTGPYPPDVPPWTVIESYANATRSVFARCAADGTCAAAFPQVERQLNALLHELDRSPVTIDMPEGARFPDGRVVLDGRLLGNGIRLGLYDDRFIPLLPMLVHEARAGNVDLLELLVDALVPGPDDVRHGIFHAVECYERRPLSSEADWLAAGRRFTELAPWHRATQEAPAWHARCEAWQPAAAEPRELAPVTSDVPTLIVAGEFDPVTPPEFAQRMLAGLSRAQVLVMPDFGHFRLLSGSNCSLGLALEFLRAPADRLDTACLAGQPPLRFVTTLRPSTGPARLLLEAQRGDWRRIGPLIICTLLLLSALVTWPLAARRERLVAADPVAPGCSTLRVARRAVGFAAVGALLFCAVLYLAVRSATQASPYLLLFGVPREFAPMFALHWLTGVFALVGLVASLVAWRRDAAPVRSCLYLAGVAAAGLVFVAVLLGAGFT